MQSWLCCQSLTVLHGIRTALLFLLLGAECFSECIKVYAVLVGGEESSFNRTFSKAWFLHFYA